jgi:competence protein ComEA
MLPRRPALQVISPAFPPAPPPIKVHVVGAVVSPAVYQLEADARVEDALKAAGGPAESADVSGLNLAMPLRDGQQLVVPQIIARPSAPASTAPPPSAATTSGKLDLNSATQRQLEDLPGIGPVTSQRILDYRDKNGRFVAIEELKEAKLVNNPTYERIKEMVEAR